MTFGPPVQSRSPIAFPPAGRLKCGGQADRVVPRPETGAAEWLRELAARREEGAQNAAQSRTEEHDEADACGPPRSNENDILALGVESIPASAGSTNATLSDLLSAAPGAGAVREPTNHAAGLMARGNEAVLQRWEAGVDLELVPGIATGEGHDPAGGALTRGIGDVDHLASDDGKTPLEGRHSGERGKTAVAVAPAAFLSAEEKAPGGASSPVLVPQEFSEDGSGRERSVGLTRHEKEQTPRQSAGAIATSSGLRSSLSLTAGPAVWESAQQAGSSVWTGPIPSSPPPSPSPAAEAAHPTAGGKEAVRLPDLPAGVARLAASLRREAGSVEVRLRLDPPSLGEVWIRIASTGHGLDIRLLTQCAEACSALAEGQPQLRAQLERHGLTLESFSASVGAFASGSGETTPDEAERRGRDLRFDRQGMGRDDEEGATAFLALSSRRLLTPSGLDTWV